MDTLFTITALTENSPGVLHRVTSVFTRRKVNVESLCVSETETKGISRFTISVRVTEDQVRKMTGQIGKIVEVVEVRYNTDDQLVIKELAFFKVAAGALAKVEAVALRYGGAVVSANRDFVVVEKAGTESEVDTFYRHVEPCGIVEFTRSGRIALEKSAAVSVAAARPRRVGGDA